MFKLPESRTIAVDLPHANDDNTESLHKKSAGTLYFSNRNSVSLRRISLLCTLFSVKISGVSFCFSIRFFTIDVVSISSSMSKLTTPDLVKEDIDVLTLTFLTIKWLNFHMIAFKSNL